MEHREEEFDESVDYKRMYLRMARAAEDAIRILIEAQRECEELYITSDDETERSAP